MDASATPSSPRGSTPSSWGWRLASRTTALAKPLAGRRFFPLWGVVHHRGRKSGRELSVPVVVRGTGHHVVIPLPWGARTNWVRNVRAAGGCSITWKGKTRRAVEPQLIDRQVALEALGSMLRTVTRVAPVDRYLMVRLQDAPA